MNRRILVLTGVIGLSGLVLAGAYACIIFPCACGLSPRSKVIDIDLIPQEGGSWCWAAATVMIGRYLGIAMPEQCMLVGDHLGGSLRGTSACCPDVCLQMTNDCNGVSGEPMLWEFGITCESRRVHCLSWSKMVELISRDEPILYLYGNESSGHMYFIIGYRMAANCSMRNQILIFDPASPCYGKLHWMQYYRHRNQHIGNRVHCYNFRKSSMSDYMVSIYMSGLSAYPGLGSADGLAWSSPTIRGLDSKNFPLREDMPDHFLGPPEVNHHVCNGW